MRHFLLTTKPGPQLMVHVEDLREAFVGADGNNTVCVLRIEKKGGGDSYVLVRDTIDEIWGQAKKMKYEEMYRDDGRLKTRS